MAVTKSHKAKSNKQKKYYRLGRVEIFFGFARFVDFCEVPGAERENDKTKHSFEVEKQNWLENVAKMFAHEYLWNKQTFATFQANLASQRKRMKGVY